MQTKYLKVWNSTDTLPEEFHKDKENMLYKRKLSRKRNKRMITINSALKEIEDKKQILHNNLREMDI